MIYYSNFPKGLSKLVCEILSQEVNDVKIIKIGDDYIHYETEISIKEITDLEFFEQTILLFQFFDNKYKNFEELINWVNNNQNTAMETLSKANLIHKSFRLVGSSPNLQNNEIQNNINSVKLEIKLNNSNPDYDIRIVEKKDYGFIGVRITNKREKIDNLQRGSLRKEIASVMLYLSEMDENDMFLDPFSGYGVIPILRANLYKFKGITASDIITSHIINKLNILKINNKNFKVISSEIKDLEKNINTKFNKVVSDIPWGVRTKISDIKTLYFQTLSTIYNVTLPNSIVILLTPHIEIIKEYISQKKNSFEIKSFYNAEISGKLSSIIKMVRK